MFFLNVLKSKDSRFLEMGCNLLLGLLEQLRTNEQVHKDYLTVVGFGINGITLTTISSILINQLTVTHKLNTIRVIGELLKCLQPNEYLLNDSHNLFVHVYQNIIREALTTLEKNEDSVEYLCEVFEDDVEKVAKWEFKARAKQDAALLFSNEIK